MSKPTTFKIQVLKNGIKVEQTVRVWGKWTQDQVQSASDKVMAIRGNVSSNGVQLFLDASTLTHG